MAKVMLKSGLIDEKKYSRFVHSVINDLKRKLKDARDSLESESRNERLLLYNAEKKHGKEKVETATEYNGILPDLVKYKESKGKCDLLRKIIQSIKNEIILAQEKYGVQNDG